MGAILTRFQEIFYVAQMRRKSEMDVKCAEVRAGGLGEDFEPGKAAELGL